MEVWLTRSGSDVSHPLPLRGLEGNCAAFTHGVSSGFLRNVTGQSDAVLATKAMELSKGRTCPHGVFSQFLEVQWKFLSAGKECYFQ